MGWLFKNLLRLLVLGAIAFAVYAFFAELPPPTERITVALEPPARPAGQSQPAPEAQAPAAEEQAAEGADAPAGAAGGEDQPGDAPAE